MLARDVMSRPAVTIGPGASLADAARTMIERRFGCLPVVDEAGMLVGVLTQSDFAAREKGIPFSMLKLPQVFRRWMPPSGVEELYREAATMPVSEVMSTDPVTVGEETPIEGVIREMLRREINHIPVVRDGRPVGVVSRHDLLRMMLDGPAAD